MYYNLNVVLYCRVNNHILIMSLLLISVTNMWSESMRMLVNVCVILRLYARDSVTRVSVSKNSARLDIPLTGLVLPFHMQEQHSCFSYSVPTYCLRYFPLTLAPMQWMRIRTRPLSPHLDKCDRVLKRMPHSVAVRKE